jgi:hypothetical protein
MKRKPLNKLTKDIIEGINAVLPVDTYSALEATQISGEDLLLSNWRGVMHTKPEKKLIYEILIPRIHTRNHIRRMEKAYQAEGKKGLIDYCKRYMRGKTLADISQLIEEQC